jgi:hypothetical protein
MTTGSTSLAPPAPGNGARFTTLDPSARTCRTQSAQIADAFAPILYELRHSVAAP